MTRKIYSLLLAVAGTALMAACSDDSFPTLSNLAPAKAQFSAALSGANEKPAATTSAATGKLNITFMDTLTVRYQLELTALDSVTSVDFSAGDANTVGPVIFTVYSSGSGLFSLAGVNTSTVNGVLKEADIPKTASTTNAGGTNVFTAPFTFDSLVTRIKAGTVYVNVHTKVNPTGAIRGQVVSGPLP